MGFYRQSGIADNLALRARMLKSIRGYFGDHGFLEVETPCRIPAPAPEAYIDIQVSGNWFLQPSPELCMKRLLAAGYPRLFQICRCFRKGERGRTHLPEFAMLEWYAAGSDYQDMMAQTEDLIRTVAADLGRGNHLAHGEGGIDLSGPWQRVAVRSAFDELGSISMDESLETGRFDEVMVSEIEPNLDRERPVFLYDYPAARGSLARLKRQDRRSAERFELYIAGLELCNGFSELTDPVEQRHRFEQERKARRSEGRSVYPMPERFLESLADMPEAAGNALGIDRLLMLFVNAETIDDVAAFVPEEL